MEQENDLRKLQLKELEILKAFIDICNRKKLKYYIVGGTLIGAIRHKGFIPWDDDMDIAMPREDYEQLLCEYANEFPKNIRINHYKYNPDVYFYPMKLVDTNVTVLEQRLEKSNEYTNLSIDIFPIDAFPDGKIKQKIYKMKFYYYKMLIGFCNVDILRNNVKRKTYEKVLIKFAKIFKLNKILKLNKIREKFDKFLKKYEFENCNMIGDITGAYGFREFVPKEYFAEGKNVVLENIKVKAPSMAEEYLTQIYGDYMKLPPEEKRVAGHIKIVEDVKGEIKNA